MTVACGTVSLGKSFLLAKLLATKYPLGLTLVVPSYQLPLCKEASRAQWIPRLQKEEADALTNFYFAKFNFGRLIPMDVTKLKFAVLSKLLDQGDAYVKVIEALKSATERAGAQNLTAGFSRNRKAEDAVKVKNPW